MAIGGRVMVNAFGQAVTLVNKYIHLSECLSTNQVRIVAVPQPNGADGLPNAAKFSLQKVTEITGTLVVFNNTAEPLQGKQGLVLGKYTCPYDASGNVGTAEAQMYKYIMALPEFIAAIMV